jgi:hypothetical protein
MEAGMPPVAGPLPDDPELEPLADAVRTVLSVLNPLPLQPEKADEEEPAEIR